MMEPIFYKNMLIVVNYSLCYQLLLTGLLKKYLQYTEKNIFLIIVGIIEITFC